jgi:hypothetical protein
MLRGQRRLEAWRGGFETPALQPGRRSGALKQLVATGCFWPGIASHYQSSKQPEYRGASDRSQGTADLPRRPWAEADSPKRSLRYLSCRPASNACRTSAGRKGELALPTHCGPSLTQIGCRKAAKQSHDTQRVAGNAECACVP